MHVISQKVEITCFFAVLGNDNIRLHFMTAEEAFSQKNRSLKNIRMYKLRYKICTICTNYSWFSGINHAICFMDLFT